MHSKNLKIFGIVAAFVVLGALYFLYWQKDLDKHEIVWENESQSTDITAIETEEQIHIKMYIYVCGAVKNPGVYEMQKDSRMFQAVEMAGGVTEDGCIEYLDMAGVLTDGERVYIPSYEEVMENPSQFADGNISDNKGLININKAGKEQLMTLPGIGEAKADAIIQYREDKGGFTSIEDIMNISGIKEAAFSKIKSLICT